MSRSVHRPLLRWLLPLGLAAGALTGGFGATSCSDDSTETNTTPGFRVDLGTRVEAASLSFTNAYDWEISLTKVAMSSGPIYYFDGAPIETAALYTPSTREHGPSLLDWFAPRTAHAHPGHYAPGEAKGEMLEATSFDLASGPATLGTGEGTSGVFRSARFSWESPAKGPLASDLGSNVLVLEGTATKDAESVTFRLTAKESDAFDAADEPALEGCAFEETDVQGNGTVVIHVDPEVWLDQAEFDELSGGTEAEPVEVPADHAASKAFVRGIKKSTAFTFSFEAE